MRVNRNTFFFQLLQRVNIYFLYFDSKQVNLFAEASVLKLMADGLTNPQISDERDRSLETINSQVKSVLEKTGSANRTQAIRLAVNVSSSFLVSPPRKEALAGIKAAKR